MTFVSLIFIVFFLLVFIVHWRLESHRAQKVWLLVCSYFFYGFWDWRFLFLLIATTAIDFSIGLGLANKKLEAYRRHLLWLSIGANLAILGFFKYFNFFIDTANNMFMLAGLDNQLSSLSIILPVGISFFTFQTMSYSIDLYRNKCPAQRDPLDFALYVSFFPQLVAGPIVRATEFLPQLKNAPAFKDVRYRHYLTLFTIGFFKKACIADNLAAFTESVFAAPATFDTTSLWMGLLFYAVQIYCDFSGYTDMAIAVAGLLGYRFSKNFDFPYFSQNISDLWRRWHISMSAWFRDYVFKPMLKKGGTNRDFYSKILFVMFLSGLWHGASWNFVLWGGIHGLFLIIHRIYSELQLPIKIPSFFATVLTFLAFAVALVFFRAQSSGVTIMYLSGLVGQTSGSKVVGSPIFSILFFLLLSLIHWTAYKYRDPLIRRMESLPSVSYSMAFGAGWSLLLALASINAQPFIYFQF